MSPHRLLNVATMQPRQNAVCAKIRRYPPELRRVAGRPRRIPMSAGGEVVHQRASEPRSTRGPETPLRQIGMIILSQRGQDTGLVGRRIGTVVPMFWRLIGKSALPRSPGAIGARR